MRLAAPPVIFCRGSEHFRLCKKIFRTSDTPYLLLCLFLHHADISHSLRKLKACIDEDCLRLIGNTLDKLKYHKTVLTPAECDIDRLPGCFNCLFYKIRCLFLNNVKMPPVSLYYLFHRIRNFREVNILFCHVKYLNCLFTMLKTIFQNALPYISIREQKYSIIASLKHMPFRNNYIIIAQIFAFQMPFKPAFDHNLPFGKPVKCGAPFNRWYKPEFLLKYIKLKNTNLNPVYNDLVCPVNSRRLVQNNNLAFDSSFKLRPVFLRDCPDYKQSVLFKRRSCITRRRYSNSYPFPPAKVAFLPKQRYIAFIAPSKIRRPVP